MEMSESGTIFKTRTEANSPLEPSSRTKPIMAHVERLATEASASEDGGNCTPQFVRRVLAARAARHEYFTADLFADPAWDILLELYALRCEQRRTSVSKLCIAAAVPTTTALRWIEKLHSDGLIEREPDRNDRRRTWVAISDAGFEALKFYFRRYGGVVPL